MAGGSRASATTNDIAQWGPNTERTGPLEFKATGKFHDDKVWNVLESFDAWYRFANGLELFFIDAVKSRGQTLEDAEVGQRTTSLCPWLTSAFSLAEKN